MKVLMVGESPGFEAAVKRMVGAEAKIETLGPDHTEAHLVVVDETSVTPKLLEKIRKQLGPAAVLVLAQDARPLRIQPMPENLARFTYREVVERVGRHVLRDYLDALLIAHSGNVTKAALAAGLERESLHRLMRRHGIDAHGYRRTDE